MTSVRGRDTGTENRKRRRVEGVEELSTTGWWERSDSKTGVVYERKSS